MKVLFASLVCLVFTISQAWAISGGPDYGTAQIRTTGIYSGVMIPSSSFSPGRNSLGLFTISLPNSGLGTGDVVIFADGIPYSGTFTGTADPDSAKLYGEIEASFVSSTTTSSDTIVSTIAALATGGLRANLVANQNIFSSASVRIEGTFSPDRSGADIQFSASLGDVRSEIAYDVIGFKQAEATQ